MTDPYYSDDAVTLWRADALTTLASLPEASVDALITDPPYSSGGMMRGDRANGVHSKYVRNDSYAGHALPGFSGDNRDQRAYGYWCALWLSECLRIVRPGGVALLFTDWRQLPTTTDALQAGGFVWRGIVPWYKSNARPQAGRFSAACEFVVWGSHGPMPAEASAACLPGFLTANPPRDRDHITEKPITIMRELMRIVPPGGTVLDPFAGSGTTLVAAKSLGLRAVGVEIDERHCETAARRLAQDVLTFG